ncbi:phosphoribosylformylglycinamidine synthase subunit PurQ [SAR202 cluster bacterium AC-409-J13_OGT_754m]|nr:phosphoribosylformylglycinamidine synthase subunit PurQ [SAR202 cluster bacterium AC-409-J13_OGT_754m]
MKFGIVVFPGTWSDVDCKYAVGDILQQPFEYLWHKNNEDLSRFDCVILPGGFSYGDYLRAGAIASLSPIMASIDTFARKGGLVLGICNGFQILCESGLLPGVLMRNDHLQFRCEWTNLKVENTVTPFTADCCDGQVLRVPISHGEGNYFADENTLHELESENRIIFRYCSVDGLVTDESNPNGSVNNIAGIVNSKGNILGMMPHPERCCESLMGGIDGLEIFQSIIRSIAVV